MGLKAIHLGSVLLLQLSSALGLPSGSNCSPQANPNWFSMNATNLSFALVMVTFRNAATKLS